MNTDIYTNEVLDQTHSIRYIHIKSTNTVGILNRISSLMRRKRFNMDEVSVSFDTDNGAHIVIAIDTRQVDLEHVLKQLQKLHDVTCVDDVTDKFDKLFNSISVTVNSEAEFDSFPLQPHRIIKRNGKIKGVFVATLAETTDLMHIIFEKKYEFRRQIIGLI